MKSEKNKSLREGQFAQKRSRGVLARLPRRGCIISPAQQLPPLQKHQRVFASTETRVEQRKKYLSPPPDLYSFIYGKYVYSWAKRSLPEMYLNKPTVSAKNKPSGVFPSGRWC